MKYYAQFNHVNLFLHQNRFDYTWKYMKVGLYMEVVLITTAIYHQNLCFFLITNINKKSQTAKK